MKNSQPKRQSKTDFLFPFFLLILLGIALLSCSTENKPVAGEQRSELIQPSRWWEKLPRPVYATLKKIGTFQDWFEVYKLTEDTYAIYEPFHFEEAICYLVLGETKAALIDTGTGIGDLKKTVQGLTALPVFVVNTHTHWDHIGDNFQFDEIWCFNNQGCIARLLNGVKNERLIESLSGDSLWKPLPQGFDPETWEIPPVKATALLNDGDVIDLGGRSLEVIHTPGHSPGSICLLDKKNRILFTGDTFFPGPLYAFSEDVNLQDYISSVDKLKDRLEEYDYLCSGHNDPWVKSEIITQVAEAFQKILDGKGIYKEDNSIRRYFFEGFDVLIHSDMVKDKQD
jgi:glyoxylase-like metal-dependent hydrolase (beta-lactamase superfamily II)